MYGAHLNGVQRTLTLHTKSSSWILDGSVGGYNLEILISSGGDRCAELLSPRNKLLAGSVVRHSANGDIYI